VNIPVVSPPPSSPPPPSSGGEVIFTDDFESGSLAGWDDGVDTNKHRILSDASLARSGSRLLEITYPQGGDGGWLTKFFMPGYDSLHVSFWVRFQADWQGPTKLLGVRGSRTDDQWSSFGVAGACPNGTDFFSTSVVTEGGSPGSTRFYSYFVGMAREPDGVTCWGRYDAPTGTTYTPPLDMSRGEWHRVDTWIRLNTPGQSNGAQLLWIDGVTRGEWTGLNFRTTRDLMLNAAQINANAQAPQTQRLYIDDFVVTANGGPGQTLPPTAPPPPPPPPGETPQLDVVTVTPSSLSLSGVGATGNLQASARDQFGDPIGASFSWTSLNTAVATVSSSGQVTARGAGSTGVVATAAGHADTANVVVTVAAPPPPPPPPPSADEPIYQTGNETFFVDGFEDYSSTTQLLTWQALFPGRWLTNSPQGIALTTSGGHSGNRAARFTYNAGSQQQDRLIEAQIRGANPNVAIATFWIRTQPGYTWINSSGNTHKIFNMNIGGGPDGHSRILLNFGSEPLTPSMPAYGRLEQNRPNISIGGNNYNQNLNYPAVSMDGSANDGNWHRITLRLTKSTSRTATTGNGRLEMWFDGTKIIEYLGDNSSRPEYGLVNVPMTTLIPDVHFPSVMNAAPPTTQWIEYDDIRIWTR
jgi:hypothetical protein